MKTSTWQCGTPRASCSGGSDIVLSFTQSLLSGGIFMFLSTQGLGNNGAGDLNLTLYIAITCLSAPTTPTTWLPFLWGKLPSKLLLTNLHRVMLLCPWQRYWQNPLLKFQIVTTKKRNMKSIRYQSSSKSKSVFFFQLQATGNPSAPPPYEKAVA